METNLKPSEMYPPIKPYQTRLIRLHGDHGSPDTPLVCDLYTADILHPRFEGLGLRSSNGQNGRLVKYEALSYAWGTPNHTGSIVCNSIDFPISQNLSEALRALRRSGDKSRYLWVDAICINQKDDAEKSKQVWNMLVIYEKAARVIAWLGPAHEDLVNGLIAAAYISQEMDLGAILVGRNYPISGNYDPEKPFDIESAVRGLTHIYTRPWFQRMWVQQEIFAAGELRLLCGPLLFKWSGLLSQPTMLSLLPQLLTHANTEAVEVKYSSMIRLDKIRKSQEKVPHEIQNQLNAIATLDQLHLQHLGCFERFSEKGRDQPDFIETLLDTSQLGATDRKDCIYGIIGITKFPAKPMLIKDWIAARRQELFIPIDYSTDITSLLCSVTWVMLMKAGLAVLAKFKVFAHDDDQTSGQALPSWVIDWRLTGKMFRRIQEPVVDLDAPIKLENAWDAVQYRQGKLVGQKLVPFHPPPEHETFREDNKSKLASCNQIIARGTIDSRFSAKGKSILRRYASKRRVIWKLEIDVYPTDLVVNLHSFKGIGFAGLSTTWWGKKRDHTPQSFDEGGLWLLRPTETNTFTLIACLSSCPRECLKFYEDWGWDLTHDRESDPQQGTNRFRRLVVFPTEDDPLDTQRKSYIELSLSKNDSAESRDFVIV